MPDECTYLECHSLHEALELVRDHGVEFDRAYRVDQKNYVHTYINDGGSVNVAYYTHDMDVLCILRFNGEIGRIDGTPEHKRYPVNIPQWLLPAYNEVGRSVPCPELRRLLHLGTVYCYYVAESNRDKDGYYLASAVFVDVAGHFPTNTSLGRDLNHAQQIVINMNKRLGISEERMYEIVGSSMRAQNRREEQ